MKALLRRLLARRGPTPSAVAQSPLGLVLEEPLPVIFAVGDVHGRLDLFRQMEARISADETPGEKLIVLLGDIIDRGPESAGMIDHLLAPPPAGLRRLCLLGNHEEMARRFLQDPDPQAEWLVHGGAEMLASYGVARNIEALRALSRRALGMRIAAHVPEEHLDFLHGLPLFLRAGRYFLCHAGVDPAVPLDAQQHATLLWSRRFLEAACPAPGGLAPDGLVVQGHMPIAAPEWRDWRINVDTGAYMTGKLSAVRLLDGAAPEFLSVNG